MQLNDLLNSLTAPSVAKTAEPLYAVLPIPTHEGYFIGKDSNSCVCLLISTSDTILERQSPIRLENLDVIFNLPCNINLPEQKLEGQFTILRCKSNEPEIIQCFLSICQTIFILLGEYPNQEDIDVVVDRFVKIFRKLILPARRTVNGLFGELFIISICSDPLLAVKAWRVSDNARFDFSLEGVYLEVKTTVDRKRTHKFTYDQCNPPENSIAIAASMFVEQSTGGIKLQAIVDKIIESISSDPDLILKLYEVINDTLGKTLNDALNIGFDITLPRSSLKFYDLKKIPAIRDSLPNELSDVTFRSKLSESNNISIAELSKISPKVSPLLPST